jgi:hypothetical protein
MLRQKLKLVSVEKFLEMWQQPELVVHTFYWRFHLTVRHLV